MLELTGLTGSADRRVGGFSLGMRQRLGLAAALLHDPEILILDEPANGLDPEGVRWLRQFLRGLAGEGKTVLMSSHILAEVAQTVDRVIILDHGHLVAQSSLEQLTAGTQHVIKIRTPNAAELRAALMTEGATAQITGPGQLEVTGSTTERVGMLAAGHSIPVFEIAAGAVNLEDVFLSCPAFLGQEFCD
jgi:ABC-2 type transport system ATP-binding protein